MIRITALMDNKAGGRGDLAWEHGLSLLVECGGSRVLFDCGKTGAFLENARALGISLEGLDAVVLSHGHYDHALGYRALVEAGRGSKWLYTGKGFFAPKFTVREGTPQDACCGFGPEFPESHGIAHRVVENQCLLAPGLWIVTGFPRKTEFETISERFLLKSEEGFRRDDFDDEVCLVLENGDSLTVVVGCSHRGIVNMVAQITARLGKPVRAVFGGTHLSDAPMSRLERTLDALAELGVEVLGFSHCSGDAVGQLVEKDPRFRSHYLGSGDSILQQADN